MTWLALSGLGLFGLNERQALVVFLGHHGGHQLGARLELADFLLDFGQGDPEELFAQVDQLVRKVAAKADAYQQAANSPLNDPVPLWASLAQNTSRSLWMDFAAVQVRTLAW